jgi:hypothetical protein
VDGFRLRRVTLFSARRAGDSALHASLLIADPGVTSAVK